MKASKLVNGYFVVLSLLLLAQYMFVIGFDSTPRSIINLVIRLGFLPASVYSFINHEDQKLVDGYNTITYMILIGLTLWSFGIILDLIQSY